MPEPMIIKARAGVPIARVGGEYAMIGEKPYRRVWLDEPATQEV